MIIAKIDDEAFIDLVEKAPVIAFQELEYGYAVAAPGKAYYWPYNHPGGGNLDERAADHLAAGSLDRLGNPHLRTLRPTAKPQPSAALLSWLANTFADIPEFESRFKKAPGDCPYVIDSECQVVIQAIEEYERPDLREAMKPGKRDMMSDVLDLVITHAEAARDLCEVGDEKPALIKMHILQATQAMKTCLEMLLKP